MNGNQDTEVQQDAAADAAREADAAAASAADAAADAAEAAADAEAVTTDGGNDNQAKESRRADIRGRLSEGNLPPQERTDLENELSDLDQELGGAAA